MTPLTTKAAEIRAGLGGVTRGEFRADGDQIYAGNYENDGYRVADFFGPDFAANCAHFARLDKPTVLAFLDERDQHLALIEQQAIEPPASLDLATDAEG
ncbi:hypothetical protein DK26_15285 [Bosea sp. WAO]|uniref:hypothetical protein n=1 Tax=Bosea sp. WAO TaxID=406341 RepID=UPI00074AE7A2|nr:hypothetical protein [Bosea sp. WAO]KUL94368.1 hypothetical protein DK26_15285 [Bosea sp. WAO]